jgi:acyl-CoA dehydrogenase
MAAGGRQPDGAQGRPPLRRGQPCGIEANATKYLGAEAGFDACETAVLVHGGMGYAKEFHVER